MSIERDCRIGDYVRCSPLSHITSGIVMEDRVFIGAGVVTINDKGMIWRDPKKEPELIPPYFEYAAKIGSGSVIAAGVRIGRNSLIGSGSVVTHDIPADVIAYGIPAKVKGPLGRSG
jgi:acetyltransferase-like isoleucine patch superfamily enzyme